MTQPTIRFDDGAAYEQMMGTWSRSVGQIFLDWLKPPPALRWLDVGCGNGAFTEVLIARCAPAAVQGIDPSEGQLAYARTRPGVASAKFEQGDAIALPYPAGSYDAAVMALVLVFVPDPQKGVNEMARVMRSGGLVSAYMWDMLGGGFPLDPILNEIRALGITPSLPPRVEASRLEALQQMWRSAGLQEVETRVIDVTRSFADLDELWRITAMAASLSPVLKSMSADQIDTVKSRLRARLPADGNGRITYGARAHAVKGRVPG